MTGTVRVGAVGNAFLAFSKEGVDAFCASTAPAASIRGLTLSLPATRRFNPPRALIKSAQSNRAEVEIPFAIVDRFESNRFANQDGAHHGGSRVPPHHAGRGHATHFVMPGIFHRRHLSRQRPWRRSIASRGWLLAERFLGPLVIVSSTE